MNMAARRRTTNISLHQVGPDQQGFFDFAMALQLPQERNWPFSALKDPNQNLFVVH